VSPSFVQQRNFPEHLNLSYSAVPTENISFFF